MTAYRGWVLKRGKPGYPDCLEMTPSPPEVLYGIGDPALLRLGLGVIGARRATPYGVRCVERFAGWAAGAGVVVFSGAARGCDQAAHLAALDADGMTVAVLGCGADVDYPSDATGLLERIRRKGAVVSELAWGTKPAKWTFPRRNRIIAGFAEALLVAEASVPSGTFNTADHALEAGRTVLAVPGSIFAPECRGTNRLIRQGAVAVTDVSELAAELTCAGLIERPSERSEPRGVGDEVLRALLADPMRPDDVSVRLGIEIVEALRRISRLEADGKVRRYPDGRYGPGPKTGRKEARYNTS